MRFSHLAPPKRKFKISKPSPMRTDPADIASAIAQLQQNQALIFEAINALNANLSQTLGFAVSLSESVALSDPAATAGALLNVAAAWTPIPSET